MIYPNKAFYHPDEEISISIEGAFRVTIWHLMEVLAIIEGQDVFTWTPPEQTKQGYRLRIETENEEYWTAFDVLNHWTDSPRYGYLFNFSPSNNAENLDYLLANHINGIQFYDWMYRHDQLLPPSEEFIDPLGREMSLQVVAKRISTAHQNNMAAMPYTAIYAASPQFALEHPDWGLYDESNTLYDFAEGFLKIMNPDSDWRQHFIKECLSVLDALPFDGIHVDQYGEPQTGFAKNATAIDLPQALAETLCDLHTASPKDKTLLFNLVHNWPLEVIAKTPVDFLYCEIWPPKTALRDLMEITQQNWQESEGKTPVVAVYIDPEHTFTAKMVECVILASGGYHLVHGEDGLYLSDPYFPEAVYPNADLKAYLQRIADFGVAYQELLSHAQPTDIQCQLSAPLWSIARESDNRLILNLLNVSADEQWNQAIEIVPIKRDVSAQMSFDRPVKRIWCASPDENAAPTALDFSRNDNELTFKVPRVETWTMICIELES